MAQLAGRAQPGLARVGAWPFCTASFWTSFSPKRARKPQCKYVHLLREVTDAVAARSVSWRCWCRRRHEARRTDRRQPGKDAAEVDLLLSQAAQRAGVSFAKMNRILSYPLQR